MGSFLKFSKSKKVVLRDFQEINQEIVQAITDITVLLLLL